MTNDTTESKGPELDPRRRYPAPTIDLTATEVGGRTAAENLASTSAATDSAPPHLSVESEGRSRDESDASAPAGGGRGASRPPGRGWNWPQWPFDSAWRLAGAGVLLTLLIGVGLWSIGGASRSDDNAVSERLARIETQLAALSARGTNTADSGSANRLTAVEAALKGLVTDTVNLNGRVSEAAEAARNARAQADAAARAAQAASAARSPSSADQTDLDALSGRIAAIEKTIAAMQKDLAKSASLTGDPAARLALVATALRLAVERGNGFSAELDEVKTFIKDPRVLAALEPFAASGVPSPAILSRDLSTLAPTLLQAANVSPPEGNFISRLQANAEHLVRIRPIDETPGDEPASVILRIELKSARGDIAGALAEFSKLPPQARAPAADWIKKAESREAAIDAARKISADALGAITTR